MKNNDRDEQDRADRLSHLEFQNGQDRADRRERLERQDKYNAAARRVPFVETPITYNKDVDEHTQMLIAKNLEICQGSEDVKISNVEKIALRAHARLDDYQKVTDERLIALDHKEVGKVTTLWNERNRIIAIGGVLFIGIIVNIVVGAMGSGKVDKTALKDAVKSALEELKQP
jgi:hypothetical protein